MSLQALGYAMSCRPGSPTKKLVLLALADCHNGQTGRCDPGIEYLSELTELGDRAIRTALAELVEMRIIGRTRKRDGHGHLGTYSYTFPLPAHSSSTAPATDAGTPPARGAAQNQEEVLEPGSESVANAPDSQAVVPVVPLVPGPKTVDRKPTTPDERTFAWAILREWNQCFGQDLRSHDWVAKIIMRIREYPEATLADHTLIIETAKAHPWWKGPPTPSVVYGNGAQFERSIQQVRAKAVGETVDERMERLVQEATR